MLQKLRERSGQVLRARSNGEAGFTLVELLVVMLILGLLAAIAIPSFFNQRDKAKDSSAKEAVRTAETAMETYATDHDGSYAAAAPADLVNIEQTLNDVGARLHVTSTATTYTVTVDSENTPNTFSISRNAQGVASLTCDVDGSDGCPANGIWG
jgi:type IV pilus assembly protein PilA